MISEAFAGVQHVVQGHQPFGDFIRATINSVAFVQFWVLLTSSFLGVGANYLWKWANDQIKGSLWKYLFKDYPKRTILSFMAIAGWTVVAMSQVDDNLAWGILINMGLTTGFAVDAMINKANRAAWTEEERAANIAKRNDNQPPKV
jgi:hypothetical protein